MAGLDLAKVVTTKKSYEWREAEWELCGANGKPAYKSLDTSKPIKKVVAYDFGVKRNILRLLTERGCANLWHLFGSSNYGSCSWSQNFENEVWPPWC